MERISRSGPARRVELPASRANRTSRCRGHGALAAALLIGASPLAYALDPAVPLRQMMVDTWQAADGLPQNSSTAIVQTADGYVWIATEEGLARFRRRNVRPPRDPRGPRRRARRTASS